MSIAVCIHAGNTCPPRLTGNANPVTTGHKSSCVASPMLQSSSLRRTLEVRRCASGAQSSRPADGHKARQGEPRLDIRQTKDCCSFSDIVDLQSPSAIGRCGKELYLPRTHVCCGRRHRAERKGAGRVLFLGRGPRAVPYNARSQICCSGKVIKKKDKDEYCCGNKVCKGMWL
ncbi:hypothetical protein NP493_7866g00000 [Ridgeia piscesae]|uniref:Galaxin-like repeats domain-containing protein n=1 Tax=Ridgeia piscesae TaxID=27915 RepID=A0AAD9IPT3_RIDPI|nr:hypothetical protein NP493_7866g00000 [Ridgeia piscesae]